MTIIIDAPLPDAQREKIQRLVPGLKLVTMPTFGAPLPKEALREAEVIYTSSANFDPADAPKLRWVQTDTAATNPIRGSAIAGDQTPVANVSGAYSASVAEFALGMLLALTRKITLGCRMQAERHWPEDYAPLQGVDLYGKTMGIVGYGSIGRQIAKLAAALGMNVLACKRRPERRADDSYLLPGTGDPEGLLPQAWFGHDQIAAMFAQSDIAMITLPDVPSTRGLIGRRELAALSRDAWLVNVGRGAVIDEPGLIECLQTGALAGAALDVFVEEPLSHTSPFWAMPNVLVMPHIASWTKPQPIYATGVLIENLRRDLRGEPLVNLIDKTLMY